MKIPDWKFMCRTYLTGFSVGAVIATTALCMHMSSFAAGVMVGVAFAVVNTTLLGHLLASVVPGEKRNPLVQLVVLMAKYPIAIGFLLLGISRGWVNPGGFLVGFSCVLFSAVPVAAGSLFREEGSC